MGKTILALVVVGLVAGCAKSSSTNRKITAAFESHKRAVLERTGKEALKSTARATLEEHRKYLDWACHGSREAVEALTPLRKYQVLRLRVEVPRGVLSKMKEDELFVYLVDEDLFGRDQLKGTNLHNIRVQRAEATADVSVGKTRLPIAFRFAKEEGRWRVDWMPVFNHTNDFFRRSAVAQGTSETAFVLRMLSENTGKKFDDQIWKPVEDTEESNKRIEDER